MSKELSRVETYGKHRKKNSVKKPPLSSKEAGAHKGKQEKAQTQEANRAPLRRERTSVQVRKASYKEEGRSVKVQQTNGSFGRLRRSRVASVSEQPLDAGRASRTAENSDEAAVPARIDTYASRRIRISKYFTNSLIVLFLFLMAFLVWWGVKGAPPLGELW